MGKSTINTLTIFLAFLACVSQVRAQSPIYLGVKGGISIPNLQGGGSASQVSNGYKSIEGPYFGIFADFKVSKHFSIQPELNYSAQGGQKNGVQAIATSQLPAGLIPAGTPPADIPPYVYASYKSKARLNYLELPILAKYSISLGKAWKFLIDAGPYVGFLMSAHDITKDSSYVYADPGETQPLAPFKVDFGGNQNIRPDIYKFNFGFQGGVGFEYHFKKCGYLYLEGGGNYGFLNIQKYTADGKNQTGAGTVALGYAFKIR